MINADVDEPAGSRRRGFAWRHHRRTYGLVDMGVQACGSPHVDRDERSSPLLGAIWRRLAVGAVSSVFSLNYVGACEMRLVSPAK